MNSYRDHWTRLIAREESGYEEISHEDLFEDWDQLISPEVRIELPLDYAIELACGGGSHALIATFCEQCGTLANRALIEQIYQRKQTKGIFPLNRGSILRAKAYATWLRLGLLDVTEVRKSVEDYLAWCESSKRSDWNEYNQSYFISALSMSFLVDQALTERILRLNYACPAHAQRHDVIRRAAFAYLQDPRGKSLSPEEYDACFDQIRCPTRPQTLPSFEMGYNRLIVYPDGDGALDPWEAIRIMSQ